MIQNITEKKEYYPNGNLKYIETIGIVSPIFLPLYPKCKLGDDDKYRVRIGVNRKFKLNGRIEWEIKYNDNGEVVI